LLNRFVKDPTARVVGIALHQSWHESFQSQLPKDVNKSVGFVGIG
jgi:hypothetical protein